MVEKICDYCKKPFVLKKPNARFCSRTCCGHANKGKHPSEETLKKLSEAHKNPFKTGRLKSAELICEYCKQPFTTYNYLKGKRQFCSNQCRVNAIKAGMIHRHYSEEGLRKISEARKGKIGWNRGKITKVKIICEICKKPFDVDKHRKNKARFCSRKCCGESIKGKEGPSKGKSKSEETRRKISNTLIQINNLIKATKVPIYIICEICNKPFEVPNFRKDKARFCSSKCRGKWVSQTFHGEKIYNYKEKIEKKCLECGKIFYVHPCREKEARFCSKKCYGVWLSKNKTQENSSFWIDGRSYYPYCHKFNDRLKERVRNRDNRTCQLCGVKENSIRQSVHHIHYDKENCYPDLISLCRECNSKVNKKSERKYYEWVFMNKLNDKGLLFWARQNDK